jgi:moderate conductance mechanosensitive channel
MLRRVARILALVLALGGAPAVTVEAEDAAPPVPAGKVEALITTLQDDVARARLIEQLRLLTAAQNHQQETEGPLVKDGLGAELLTLISDRVKSVSDVLAQAAQAVDEAPDAVRWVGRQAGDPITRGRWIETAIKVVIVLGLATAVEIGVSRLLGRVRRRLAEQPRNGWIAKLLAVALRGVLELMPIIAFAAAAYGILPLTEPRTATRLIVLTLVNASVLARAVSAVGRLVLSPGLPRLRLVPIGDETANYAQIWIRRLANAAIYGYFLIQGLLLIGVPTALCLVLLRAVGLLVATMVVVLILQNRATVAEWIGAGVPRTPHAGRVRFADIWHFVTIFLVAALYVVWAFAIPGGLQFLLRGFLATLVILTVARLLTLGLAKALRRGFALNEELKRRYPGLEGRANRYVPMLLRLLTGVVWLFAVLSLLEAWGLDAFGWLSSDIGRKLTGSLVSIVLVLTIMWVAWELLDTTIERYLEERRPDGAVVDRSSRAKTLLPLMRNASRVVLAVMALLIVLSELGLNIGPLLAGAGVVGLAVGFGAQTLVKDLITGIFILIEESMSVGDVVDLGGHSGVVESMNIRSVRIRDAAGSVHIIPFSDVATVVNMTKDYAFAVLTLRIAYDDDVDRTIGVLQTTGHELQQDPALAAALLGPIEVLGIDGFADLGVVIKARIKTRPGRQWSVEREFNRRAKLALAEAGIALTHAAIMRTMPSAQRAAAPA